MKSKLLASARVFPDGTKLVPLLTLPGGKNKTGTWSVCVAEGDLEAARAAIGSGTVPDIQAAITCLTPDGKQAFYNVELRNFGGWCAPNFLEELDLSFDLPDGVPLVGLGGETVKATHPIKGVIFVDKSGKPYQAPNGEKPKVLRYNLTNFFAEGGTVSEDGRTWKVTVNGAEYTGHLYYTGTDNAMRIFGMVAYVMITDTPPDTIVCGEAVALVPELIATRLS